MYPVIRILALSVPKAPTAVTLSMASLTLAYTSATVKAHALSMKSFPPTESQTTLYEVPNAVL